MRYNQVGKILALLPLLLISGCSNQDTLFKKAETKDTGISFENTLTDSEDFNVIDYLYFYNGGGVAIGDINGDDLPDIFFSGNQVKNKLYLNKGNLKFEDITEAAGVAGKSTWNTGSVMGDVNGDGLLDIYVCAVVGLKGLRGYNELFINNGDNTFTERAADFGLDFDSYSSSAAFLDYDQDGDLDMYILNHAVHTQESFGHADLRNRRSFETGDKLMRNDDGKFVDVSAEAGIFGGINGYGLGLAVSDFNADGYPDLYIGNDFHEDDYYYINNGDGTFTENVKAAFAQVSRFSMGNDVADINHDGLPDLISLDMLADDELVLKRSEGDEDLDILELRRDRYGYHYQFARNMLQLNQGNGTFAETALMSGVAATDWSWSALFSDFDQDGNLDLFISNGIPRRPNDLDYIKFVFSEQIKGTMDATKLVDQEALQLMPSGKVKNVVFKGKGDGTFTDVSDNWIPNEQSFSNATALADLDNDGDMDVVINNVNSPASILINQTNEKANYVKLRLKYDEKNALGIGTKIYSYQGGNLQYKELYTVRGFQASSEPVVHFGYGKADFVDSIKIVWPDGRMDKLTKIAVNQALVVSPMAGSGSLSRPSVQESMNTLFQQVSTSDLGIDFTHVEDRYTDFDRMKLLPYQQSDRGPATAIGDLNGDGKMDVFFGGSKRVPSQIFIQGNASFNRISVPFLAKDSLNEEVAAAIADFNGDGKSDLFVGTGGADFFGRSKPLLDVYYTAEGPTYLENLIDDYYENASCVRVADYNKDGFPDVFVGNESVSGDFGNIPQSYLLSNEKGTLKPVQRELFGQLGMVTDAVWTDYNQDGNLDLVVVGEWMTPTFFKNTGSTLEQDFVLTKDEFGLWQSIIPFDIDQDNDMDFIVGNWGLNSKYRATQEFPMYMYYGDFDGNGATETIISVEKDGKYYSLDGFDMLAGQMVSLRKKFLNYSDFAGKTTEEVFSKELLEKADVFKVTTLASGFLKNDGGKFSFQPFAQPFQMSPMMALTKFDFDGDGKEEVLMGGNYFGVQPFHGRFGSFNGAMVKTDQVIQEGKDIGLNFHGRSVRELNVISVGASTYLLVTINDGPAQLYRIGKGK